MHNTACMLHAEQCAHAAYRPVIQYSTCILISQKVARKVPIRKKNSKVLVRPKHDQFGLYTKFVQNGRNSYKILNPKNIKFEQAEISKINAKNL